MTRSCLTTLCYIQKDNQYLMLHRVVKKNDINKDKWIGIGGHFEAGESPEECLLREAKEETGLILTRYKLRGIVTFICGENEAEYMFLYTADEYKGEMIECDEGELEWVPIDKINQLNLWKGDLIFFDLLKKDVPFFSLKLAYEADGTLYQAVLDGEELEI